MTALGVLGGAFAREHLRAPLTVALLVTMPAFFVLVFAEVLGEFAAALGGSLAERSATAISAGWAAAMLAGSLGFFQVASSREADRRLALAGLGAARVALARIAAAVALGAAASAAAYLTLWVRTGIAHPAHAAIAIFAFAAIYIGLGALVGVFVSGSLEGSLLVVLIFLIDVFSGPAMTSAGGLTKLTPTRDAADLLMAAGAGEGSTSADWLSVAAMSVGALAIAGVAFWLSARSRS